MKLLKTMITYCALSLALTACGEGPVGNTMVPQPLKPVNLKQYIGRWYEIGRYENRFETNCEGVTAEYAEGEGGLVLVTNTCHKGAVNGLVEVADGKAKIVEGSGNAKLKVSFFGPFYVGDYWVLDHADDYSWSIVGEQSGKYLWILSRQPVVSEKLMESLFAKVKGMGYDTSLIYRTKQSAN